VEFRQQYDPGNTFQMSAGGTSAADETSKLTMDEAGQFVLGSALRRTWKSSVLELDVLSAAIRHDEILKRPSALHLFSDELPAKRWALSWIREQKVEANADELIEQLRGWNPEAARSELTAWCGVAASVAENLGQGRRLGVIERNQIEDAAWVEVVARALTADYLTQGRELRVPYFDVRG